ncbi:MAG: hypothetical protein [Bacteriophage sp.]|nr:MAG: hypothetical protein [Bacteriophage sp.]
MPTLIVTIEESSNLSIGRYKVTQINSVPLVKCHPPEVELVIKRVGNKVRLKPRNLDEPYKIRANDVVRFQVACGNIFSGLLTLQAVNDKNQVFTIKVTQGVINA